MPYHEKTARAGSDIAAPEAKGIGVRDAASRKAEGQTVLRTSGEPVSQLLRDRVAQERRHR